MGLGDSESPVGVGIVGCGSVLRNYAAMSRILQYEGLISVVAACDVDEGRESFVRRQFGRVRFTGRFEDIVEADDVDLVLVLTSPSSHGEVTIAALEADKHVLVEKPMAPTLTEAARIVELANEKVLALVCAPHVILSPTFQIMWKRVRQGDIGKVCLARARYGEGLNLNWGKWRYAGPGAGPLAECGVYNIVSLTGLIGPVKRVTAMGGIAIPTREVSGELMNVEANDNYQVLLDFGEGVFASVATGYTMVAYRSPAIELYGSEGVIQMLGDDWAPEGYELYQGGAWQFFAESDPGWHWTSGLRHIVKCIKKGEPPLITPEHAYHVQEVMWKMEEATADGQTHQIDSTFPELNLGAVDIHFDPVTDESWPFMTVSR